MTFSRLKKMLFLDLKNILCFCSNVCKCALERKFTMQSQIIPFKTQSAIFKNSPIFRTEYLKPLSCQTLHSTCLVQLKQKSGGMELFHLYFGKTVTHLNLSVCIQRQVIMQQKKEKRAALTHVTDIHGTWPLIQHGSVLGSNLGNLLSGINYLNDTSTMLSTKRVLFGTLLLNFLLS